MATVTKTDVGKVAVRPCGTHSETREYERLDLVYKGNSSYVSLQDKNIGHSVTDAEWWQLIVDGDTASDAASKASSAATSASDAATKATAATTTAKEQAARAKALADNPNKIGDNGNWWTYSESAGGYIDTGILATGGVVYPSFDVDGDGQLIMSSDDEVSADHFKMDEDGVLNYEY